MILPVLIAVLAADASSLTPWALGISTVGALGTGLALMGRQVTNLIRENLKCNRQVGILYKIVVEAGLPIPRAFYGEVRAVYEAPLPDDGPPPRRRRR